MQRLFLPVAAVAAVLPAALRAQPPEGLEEIVVTAAFRDTNIEQLPASVTVLDRETLRETTQQHFEEAIRQVPNLNLSGEGSRARYFQLRGVGELEQYEGSPNPSIGFIVDDIDFSGLGAIGTLFDIDRVEVLRGPQGSRYGANALGGLIYLRSIEPSRERDADVEATVGSDGTRGVGAAAGGPLSDTLAYRASVQKYESDGFRDNVYLNRHDTYGRDELTARGKLKWTPSDRVAVDFTALYIDIDNGYDAWAIDNGFRTYTDKPGRDAQRSKAVSARVTAELDRVDIVSITGVADTSAVFSFDADWGNAAYWAPYVYDYVDATNRERRTYNEELRVLSKPGAIAGGRGDWLVGVYALDLDESNDHLVNGVYSDPFCGPDCDLVTDSDVLSRYDATNVAVFGQVRISLTSRLDLTAGLRAERRTAHYGDSSGYHFAPDDNMNGGDVAFDWKLAERRAAYVRLARGYKAGGFNVSLAGVDFSTVDGLTPNEIQFGPEFLTSLEAGVRATSADGRLRVDVGAFAARRMDQQIKVPIQLRLGDPSSFLLVTANAERGEHHGVEASLDWRAGERVALNAAVGWLATKIDEFSLFPSIEGREEAHAPRYTYSLGATYRTPSGWWGRVDVQGMDKFFFDYGHDQMSKPYSLTNLSVGRDFRSWSVKLWARNVFDKEYFVRGFYFGNEPPDFPNRLYTRLGDPRQVGLTMSYHW
ncbi:MAG TPA: TonB-dependent receptor [Gammaproteobacteria bacterium]|nr:TonB-dependent receptor [Gammaproteobacteria bacterium]